MGNENKENENIEELVCENNPFADSSNKETEEKTEEAKVCEDAISSLKDEIDKIINIFVWLLILIIIEKDKCKNANHC